LNKLLVWPVAGVVLGTLLAKIHLETGITFGAGFAAWGAVMALILVLVLSAHPIGARVGAVLAGLFLAVPCFVRYGPFARALLLGLMLAPIAAAAALVLAPPLTGLRARMAYLLTYANTHPVTRRERGFDAAAFLRLILATIILGAAIAVVKAAGASGLGLLVRWLAGEIAALAVAEMITAGLPFAAAPLGLNVPPLMQSPYRSASVSEFWAKRWNLRVSEFLFRKCCFAPFARQGVAIALFVPFAISAGAHVAIAYVALGRWGISLICGAFFLVQPLLIAAERWLTVRRWRPAARHAWTLAVLTLVSPLFIEPALQAAERDWGGLDQVPGQALALLGVVIAVSSVIALASLTARPPPGPAILIMDHMGPPGEGALTRRPYLLHNENCWMVTPRLDVVAHKR
jgi:hypothetical protein